MVDLQIAHADISSSLTVLCVLYLFLLYAIMRLRAGTAHPGDFPDPKQFRDACISGNLDILAFPSLSSKEVLAYLDTLDAVSKFELSNVSQIHDL